MIQCTLSNSLEITGADPAYIEWLERFCLYNLEAFPENDTGSTMLSLFAREGDTVFVPRGILPRIQEHCKQYNYPLNITFKGAIGETYDFQVKPEINFTTGIYHYQNRVINELKNFNTVRLEAPAGCHAKDTPILMYNGTIKKVQDVVVGDKIMGPDSLPRNVNRVITGKEPLYKVIPIKGEPFIVNRSHILRLVRTQMRVRYKRELKKHVNISVKEYLTKSRSFTHNHKLYKIGVDFTDNTMDLPIDPYILGLLLGDGTLHGGVSITTADSEIVREIRKAAKTYRLLVRREVYKNNKSSSYHFVNQLDRRGGRPNILIEAVRSLGLYDTRSGDKFIPTIYKITTRENRLKILAGLLDTDGYYHNGYFEYCTKSNKLAEDFKFIAHSLGFVTSCRVKVVNGVGYNRINLMGNDLTVIPLKIRRKQAAIRKQKKNVTRTGFTVKDLGYTGDYYGFELDGDHLYLDGNFFVHHNSGKTVLACLFIALMKKGPVLFLANRDKLLRQFVTTVEKVLGIPKDQVGIIKADKFDIKPITAGSLATIGKETFNIEQLRNVFPIVFFDECHISTALTYRRVLLNLAPQHLIGLSATPDHYISTDLNNLMSSMLGPVGVKVDESDIPERLTPRILRKETGRNYQYKAKDNSPEWMKFKCRNKLQNDIADDYDRNRIIVNDCKALVARGYKVLITVARVHHGFLLNNLLTEAGVRCAFPYTYKERKDDGKEEQKVDHKALDKASIAVEEGTVDTLIGTINLFKEGFDCRPLSAILFAAPFSGINSTTIIQSIGRIQRHFFNKFDAIVIDYADNSQPTNVLKKWADDRSRTLIDLYGIKEYDHLK